MRAFVIRLCLGSFALAVVAYPLSVWYANVMIAWNAQLLGALFPAFGLAAFSIMYLHIIGRPFAQMLEKYVPFRLFESASSTAVLALIILHPLVRTVYYLMQGFSLLPPVDLIVPIGLGVVGFCMLLTYDMGRLLYRNRWVAGHTVAIDVVSTLGFYVIAVHALSLGSDLQVGTLRTVWLAYSATAAGASLYVLWMWQRAGRMTITR
jgi:hypothetical protein